MSDRPETDRADADRADADRTGAVRAVYRHLRIGHQLDFYRQRAAEYTRANDQAIMVRNVLLGLAALAGAFGQFAGGSGRVAAGVTAAVLAAVAGAVTAFEALIGFGPVAKLYDDAAVSLEEACLHWDSGDDLAADVERIEQVFRAETGQWGQLAVQAGPPPTTAEGVPPADPGGTPSPPAGAGPP